MEFIDEEKFQKARNELKSSLSHLDQESKKHAIISALELAVDFHNRMVQTEVKEKDREEIQK